MKRDHLPLGKFRRLPGALAESDCPHDEVRDLLRLVGGIEEMRASAFLLYAEQRVQKAPSHPIWTQRVIYAGIERGRMTYLGMSEVPRSRLALRDGWSRHEHLGPLLLRDPYASIYAVPARRTIDRSLEQRFSNLVNYEGIGARASRHASRIAKLLSRIAATPGIVISSLVNGMCDRQALEELLEAQMVCELGGRCSKTGRPTRTYYPGGPMGQLRRETYRALTASTPPLPRKNLLH